ncbi:MAG TPA: hydroxymethylbilane synthase [Candidatus Acidoferrales bacterium]|nr:hydroxymethylbilane synthase [Candidatus Acidoferrales bacterium]
MRIRLGTRGSRLALAQSELVAGRLRRSGQEVEVVVLQTEGDLRPLDLTPGEGVFVAALARALLAGEIDLAVHSAKDVPLEEDLELCIAAYPERADPRDALVTREGGRTLETLPKGARVGTDSPRRSGFLRAARPDLRVVPLHGNVDTRLDRLDAGAADALVLAAAGVDRLERSARIDTRLPPEVVPPAPGQGALAVQARRRDRGLLATLRRLDNREVRLAVEVERRVLDATGGGCRAPVGALAALDGQLNLVAAAVSEDGERRLLLRRRVAPGAALQAAEEMGRELAARVRL